MKREAEEAIEREEAELAKLKQWEDEVKRQLEELEAQLGNELKLTDMAGVPEAPKLDRAHSETALPSSSHSHTPFPLVRHNTLSALELAAGGRRGSFTDDFKAGDGSGTAGTTTSSSAGATGTAGKCANLLYWGLYKDDLCLSLSLPLPLHRG